MRNQYGVQTGDIIRVLEYIPGYEEAERTFVVCHPAYHGDGDQWIVAWVKLPPESEKYEVHGRPPFVLQLTAGGTAWKSISPYERAHGLVMLADITDQKYVVDRYDHAHGTYKTLDALAAFGINGVEYYSTTPDTVIEIAGKQRKIFRELAEKEMETITELIPAAAAAGIPETKISSKAQVDRMTVRRILGK